MLFLHTYLPPAAALLRAGAALVACLLFAEPADAAGRTIVGRWAPDPAQCTPLGGMIAIDALDMVGDEFRCDFKSVSRAGDVVTWNGACGFPTLFEPAKVVASLDGDVLHVRINNEDNGAYRRCK